MGDTCGYLLLLYITYMSGDRSASRHTRRLLRGTGEGGLETRDGGGILNLIPPGPGAGPSIATHEPGHGIVLCCRAGHINTRA